MSNSHNWKKLGANSGNMYTHRNIKANKLNYTDGKWKDIENPDGKKIGISYSVSNSVTDEKMLVGIGTSQPFSRLSLGSNTNDGSSNEVLGRLAAIAVHEESDGKDFHGLSYVTDISSAYQDDGGKTNALALYSNSNDKEINTETASVYITDENITTIGGKPRRTFSDYDSRPVTSDNSGVPIKLDCQGSMNVSGFISFMNHNSTTLDDRDNPANASADITNSNATRNIPVGSIWTGYITETAVDETPSVALYIQDVSGKRQIVGTGSGGGSIDVSGVLWEGKESSDFSQSYLGKSGSNITFTPSTDTSIVGTSTLQPDPMPPNAVTITRGNLSVVGKENYDKKVLNSSEGTLFGLPTDDDNIGGIIWAERKIAIGCKETETASGSILPEGLLDISGNVNGIPAILINTITGEINAATNSVIISNTSKTIGLQEGSEGDNIVKDSILIGNSNVYKSNKSIILGDNNTIGKSSGSIIDDNTSGKNIIISGENNQAINEINTVIIGKQNTVDSSGNTNTNNNGNIVFGYNNKYYSKNFSGDNQIINENNMLIGDENYLIDSEYSVISGNDNHISGKNNLIAGNSNKIGTANEIEDETTAPKVANNTYVLGNTNKIEAHDYHPITNTYMFGNNHNYNATDGSFIDISNSSTMMFGSYGRVNWDTTNDLSNQRFIFSTKEKFYANGGKDGTSNGHVFMIDQSGNTVVEGNLTVKGALDQTLSTDSAIFTNIEVSQDLSCNDASFNSLIVSKSRVDQIIGSVMISNNDTTPEYRLEGIHIVPNNGSVAGHGGGYIKFKERYDGKYGFSIGYNGTAQDGIFNWPENSFVISRNNNNATGSPVITISRESGNINISSETTVGNLTVNNGLSTNTITNVDNDMIITNKTTNKDIVFRTNTGGTISESMKLVANGKQLKIYGGYESSNGVTIDSNGNLKMKGKLTVDGDIDPTGLILTSVSSVPNYTGKLALFYKDGNLQFTKDGGTTTSTLAIGSTSGGSGSGTVAQDLAKNLQLNPGASARKLVQQVGNNDTSLLDNVTGENLFLTTSTTGPSWTAIQTATTSRAGIIKVGSGLAIQGETLRATYSLPTASEGQKGGIRVGTGLTMSGHPNPEVLTLQTASPSQLGGIKVGTGLAMDGETLKATYSLPTASTGQKGGIMVGTGLAMDGEILSLASQENITLKEGNDRTITINQSSTTPSVGRGWNLTIQGGKGSSDGSSGGNLILKGGERTGAPAGGITGEVFIYSDTLKLLTASSNQTATFWAMRPDGTRTAKLDIVSTMLTISNSLKLENIKSDPLNSFELLQVDSNGNVSTRAQSELPTASPDTKGGIKVGTGLTMSDENLTLQTASPTQLGGIKVGTGLTMSSENLTLQTASSSQKGGIKVGTGLTMNNETLSVSDGRWKKGPDPNDIYYDGSGKVGIGTSSPSAMLELYDYTSAQTVPSDKGLYTTGIISFKKAHPIISGRDFEIGKLKFQTNQGPLIANLCEIVAIGNTAGVNDDQNGRLEFRTLNNGSGTNSNDFTPVTRMIINSDGNVGIGLRSSPPTNPQVPDGLLHIQENGTGGGNKTILYLQSKTSGGTPTNQHGPAIEFQTEWASNSKVWKTAKIVGTLYNAGGGGALRFFTSPASDTPNTAGLERMTIDRAGNVGIGTTSPLSKLDLASTGGFSSIRMGGIGPAEGAVGTCSIGRQYHVNSNFYSAVNFVSTSTEDYITFQTHHHGVSEGERMRIDANGNVGIGTKTPGFPLEVKGKVEHAVGNRAFYAYRVLSGNTPATNYGVTSHGNVDVCIKAEHSVWSGNAFVSSSDERIKENIIEVPDNLALQMLRDIDCNYYEYKDKIKRGTQQTIGFIAQQVKQHLPMAVSVEKSIIPNEMRLLETTWDGLNMSSDLTDVSGVKYRFYVSNDPSGNDEVQKEIIGNADNTFTFDQQYNNIFCYGKEVDDFHTVDKQKLFTVNFSATQEIDKIQQQEKTKLAAAEERITALETENASLKAQLNSIESRLAALETQ